MGGITLYTRVVDAPRESAERRAAGTVVFAVEQAGCAACATRVRDALSPLGSVVAIEVDEDADLATVEALPASGVTEERVNAALLEASAGSGHAYRVRPQSWRTVNGD